MSPAAPLLDRRTLIAGLAALAPVSALAQGSAPSDPALWLAYEERLNTRLRDGGGGRFEQRMAFDLLPITNAARRRAGAPACEWDEDLAAAARAHAADLASRNYSSHLSPEGFDPSHRLAILARRRIGSASENIAYRRNTIPTAANMLQVWRESEPHWTNLLSPSHRRVGYGVVTLGQRTCAVGRYGRLDGEFGAPLPFRVRDEAQLDAALAAAPAGIEGFSLSDPSDDHIVAAFTQGEAPPLRPGVYQLGPRLKRGGGPWIDVLWGPIFVRL